MLENNSSSAQHESDAAAAVKPREFELLVNGTPERWTKSHISYEEIVRLAFPSDPNPKTIYDVTYKHGPKENREGSLVHGESVVVKSGMVFSATPTGQS